MRISLSGFRQRGSGDLESIGYYQITDYSAMKEVKSGATKYPASLT